MGWKAWIGAALMALGGAALAQDTTVGDPPLSPPATPAAAPPATTGAAQPLTAPDLSAWLDGYLPYALSSGDMVGAVVVVVRDGQVLAAKGYGYADAAKRTPVDPATTLFRPGSVSKLITWTAVMQQVEAGRIDLDADINRYLDFKIPARDDGPITMRHLLTHTAGFEEAVRDLITYQPDNYVPLEPYLKRWTPTRIFKAGTTPAYSNWGTTLAAYIVQRVSGAPFDEYIERRIFAPLDMRTATFRQPLPPALRPLMAVGQPLASEPAKPFEFIVPAPAGGMSASGLDMAKFMVAHLAGGRGLMRPETAALMHRAPTAPRDPRSLLPPLNRMELGFFETNINGREVIAHLGDVQAFHTALHMFTAERVGLYVSFSSAGKDGAAQRVRGQLFRDFANRYFPSTEARDGRVDPRVAAEHARMMVGQWQNSRQFASNFPDVLNLFGEVGIGLDADGGLLIPALTGPGGGVQQWDEIAPFVWRDRNGYDRLAAQVVDGRVVRWSFDMVSPFAVFDRVPAHRSSSWLVPAILASLAVLLLTALFWPLTWFVRRRYAAPLKLSGPAVRAYRATRVMAWAELLVAGAWATLLVMMFSELDLLSADSDGLVWLLKIAGALVFVGAVGIAGWNAWLTWRDGRRWPAKLWNTLVLLATIVVLYVAVVFHLLAPSVNY